MQMRRQENTLSGLDKKILGQVYARKTFGQVYVRKYLVRFKLPTYQRQAFQNTNMQMIRQENTLSSLDKKILGQVYARKHFVRLELCDVTIYMVVRYKSVYCRI